MGLQEPELSIERLDGIQARIERHRISGGVPTVSDSKRSKTRRRSFLALGETSRAVSKRFEVIAPPGTTSSRRSPTGALRQARRVSELRRITSRFVLLLAAAGILPLLVYGAVSIFSLRDATRRSVITGNENVARRVAEQIGLYVQTNVDILQSVAGNLADTNLEQWQQDRILKNAVLDFPEFREITLYDAAGSAARLEPGRTVEDPVPAIRNDLRPEHHAFANRH